MARKISLLILLSTVVFTMLFLNACKNDDNNDPSIMGSWVRNIGENDEIPVQISLYSNSYFEWIPLIPTESYTRNSAKYTYSGGMLTITNDTQCPEPGKYSVAVKGSTLTLTLVEDDCAARITKLSGNWSRKNMMTDVRLQGVWLKTITIADTARQLVFIPQQNGAFEWLISKETNLYQSQFGRYAVGDDYVAIFNFLDCASIVGYYTYTIQEENKLILTPVEDNCSIRTPALSGTWNLQPSN